MIGRILAHGCNHDAIGQIEGAVGGGELVLGKKKTHDGLL
jgi:hypothetical protein